MNRTHRMLKASERVPFGSTGMTFSRPSYRCSPIARVSGSTRQSCPESLGRPIFSWVSPFALVLISAVAES